MKVIKLLVLSAVLLLGATSLTAQTKLGHINVPLLLSQMPETKKADAQVETVAKTLQTDFEKMYTDYQNKLTKYNKEASTVSEAMNQTRAKEMQDSQQRLEEYSNSAQQEIEKKRNDLYQPIFKKAQDAIDAVGKEKGLMYIFDTSKGVIIYDGGGVDVLPDVKKKLGLQ